MDYFKNNINFELFIFYEKIYKNQYKYVLNTKEYENNFHAYNHYK